MLYLDDSNNKVGINSTSPSVALDVVGDLNVSGNITGIGGTLGGTLVGNVYASSGISTFNDLLVNGDLTVQGDTTTLNTTLRNVELLRVSTASTLPAGIITQTGTGDILSLRDNTSEVFKVADGGNVTTSNNLTVGGQINLPDSIVHSGNDNAKIRFVDTDTVTVETAGSERLRITSAGLVGIGTVTPTRELTIYSPDSGSTYINLTNATTGATTSDGFGIGLGGDEDAKLWNYENTDMMFATNSTERLRINSSGLVGIGTDNPTAKLTTSVTHANSAVADALRLTTTGTYSSSNSSDAGPAISFGQFHNTYTTWKTAQIAGIRKGNNWHGALVFYTNDGGSQTDITEKLRITSAGNIGIGTNVPTNFNAAADNLVVGGGVGHHGMTIWSAADADGWLVFNDAPNNTLTGAIQYNHVNNYMEFRTNATPRLRINSSGSVLIAAGAGGTDISHSSADDLQIGDGTVGESRGLTIYSGNTNNGSIYFADGSSGADRYKGFLQ